MIWLKFYVVLQCGFIFGWLVRGIFTTGSSDYTSEGAGE